MSNPIITVNTENRAKLEITDRTDRQITRPISIPFSVFNCPKRSAIHQKMIPPMADATIIRISKIDFVLSVTAKTFSKKIP